MQRVIAPRWFKLSYLVTAWTQRPEDEHRLLSALLGALIVSLTNLIINRLMTPPPKPPAPPAGGGKRDDVIDI